MKSTKQASKMHAASEKKCEAERRTGSRTDPSSPRAKCHPRSVAIVLTITCLFLAAPFTVPCVAKAASVPGALQTPLHQKVLLRLYAKGWQIYQRVPNPADSRCIDLTLKGSEAMLFAELGNAVGWHHVGASGPVWELDKDGGKVCGPVLQSVHSPVAGALPWSLTRVHSHEGSGLLNQATYVQMKNTQGGQASSADTNAIHQGKELRVSFTAEVVFYREKR